MKGHTANSTRRCSGRFRAVNPVHRPSYPVKQSYIYPYLMKGEKEQTQRKSLRPGFEPQQSGFRARAPTGSALLELEGILV